MSLNDLITQQNGTTIAWSTAKQMNMLTLYDYYKRLRLIALTAFEWQGLPDSASARYLEQTLYSQGRALFFKDKTKGSPTEGNWLTLPVTPASALNCYNLPVDFIPFSMAYNYSTKYDETDSVLIMNNYDMLMTEPTVILFAQRMTNAERTIDVNIRAQKTPVVVLCPDKRRQTMKNVYQQVDENEGVIMGAIDLEIDKYKSLNTEAPYVADKITIYKHNLWNEFLTFMGLDNANTDKKERLITDEVESNNQVIEMSGYTMLSTRQEAAEKMSKISGLEISCDMRGEFKRKQEEAKMLKEQLEMGKEGAKNDE